MAYTKQTWSDLPSKTTPINASRLGHIEQGIYDAAATADNASTAISAMGTAVSKNSTNAVTQNSGDLVESGAVYTAIANAKASCYKPSGDKTCAELVAGLLVQSNLGNVYNITDSGTTTSDFVGGAGKPISVGDNVAIVDVGSSVYKFDLLTGMVDLSDYQTKALSAQVEGQSTVEGALGALSDADKTTRQLIDDTVGWVGKNRLPLTLEGMKANNTSGTWSGNTYTRNGATFVFNIDADGNVLSINATAGSNIQTMPLNFSLPAGNYILSSGFTESYGNNDTLLTKNNTVIARGNTRDPGQAFSLNETSDLVWNIRINSGSYTAYPMIQRADDLDPTFVPYHPSVDSCKADNSVIGAVEGANASKAWSVGEHFIKDGAFKEVTNPIASGEAINSGNTVGKPIAELLDVVEGTFANTSNIASYYLKKIGKIVNVYIKTKPINVTSGYATSITSLPSGFEPTQGIVVMVVDDDGALFGRCSIGTNGNIYFKNGQTKTDAVLNILATYLTS